MTEQQRSDKNSCAPQQGPADTEADKLRRLPRVLESYARSVEFRMEQGSTVIDSDFAIILRRAAKALRDAAVPELGALDATLEEAIKRAAEWAYRGAPKDECESTIRDVVKLARSGFGRSDHGELIKIDDGQSTHARTAKEWLDLARADLASRSAIGTIEPGSDLWSLIDAVNVAWVKCYGEGAPADTVEAAHKRIHMLGQDVICGRENFKAANAAYIKADEELRAARSTRQPRPLAEVRLNDDGTLDEVVTKDGDQLEQMDRDHWFLQINDVAVWLTSRKPIKATYERREAFVSATGRTDG